MLLPNRPVKPRRPPLPDDQRQDIECRHVRMIGAGNMPRHVKTRELGWKLEMRFSPAELRRLGGNEDRGQGRPRSLREKALEALNPLLRLHITRHGKED